MSRKIKVLIIDDSASVRNTLIQILSLDSEIEVIGAASDPYEAVSMISVNLPDVITLDIEMPRMNGLTFLGKLMKQHPIPVVVISSVVGEGSEVGIRALKLGAKEIISKPRIANQEQLDEYSIRITDAIKASSMTQRIRIKPMKKEQKENVPVNQPDQPITVIQSPKLHSEKIILLGASTGGTEVISRILKNLRTDLPGILIVQHMPGEFTKAFAKRLNTESHLNVKEAEHGDVIYQGNVYIANGFNHLQLIRENGQYKCKLEMGPLVNRHRPSVDVLFKSAVKFKGKNITAILMTGMGADGARGMLELHQAGAMTFAQDEKSSVIFGMPKEAIKLNAARMIGNPEELIKWLNTSFQ
ncbi:MAG: chemotaxis response regulator protein-glutamate methylesterase [Bacteroidota bacterium]|nr:chemotaxis response regulator protein-glutamate methylesterase [Odoribacter sp.]MDP3643973.1 chemotaxis response regulator protein-glutamate methylesterase [Bacteroidota bacterium]